MGSLVHARPLTPDDEDVLAPVDAAYARRFGLEPLVSRASLSFYVRSGHAFVAVRSGQEVGFAFAQAVWNGARPTVYLNRLAVMDPDVVVDLDDASSGDLGARLALVEAVTKSAYDAAVYDLQALLPAGDALGRRAFIEKSYGLKDYVIFERTLGSRGAQKEA